MFDQHNDGSHEVTLHNISRPGRDVHHNTSGVLKWSRDTGITYLLTFTGNVSLSQYYLASPHSPGVGRFLDTDYVNPQWIAETDDGTEVRLYGVNETPSSTRTSGTLGSSTSCSFAGRATFAVIEIPANRMLAFDNSTKEDYRMFFVGATGRPCHTQEDISFQDQNGVIHDTCRCSITLSHSPRVSLVSSHGFIKCKPSGWIAFENAPTTSDCELSAFAEQNFISFINGEKIPFHWADRRVASRNIRRTYFGWVKARQRDREEADHQPLPLMNGVAVFKYGEEVLSHLANLFQSFIAKNDIFDFGAALHPLWTALDGVLEDRLALASVSLERTASLWESCKAEVLISPPPSDASVWNNKPLLRTLRKSLHSNLDEFIDADSCSGLTEDQKVELREVVTARINNMTGTPNSARLRRPFEDLQIPVSPEENEAIQQRNTALHGLQDDHAFELKKLDKSAEYFDRIRMLITKFVLTLCGYKGPYIDYASRPAAGNFEVKRLQKGH